MDVVARELDFRPAHVPEGTETIAGYGRTRLQRPPRVNDVVESEDVRLVVLEVRLRRIIRLRGERQGPAPALRGERSSMLVEKS